MRDPADNSSNILPKPLSIAEEGCATSYFYSDVRNKKKFLVCVYTWAFEFWVSSWCNQAVLHCTCHRVNISFQSHHSSFWRNIIPRKLCSIVVSRGKSHSAVQAWLWGHNWIAHNVCTRLYSSNTVAVVVSTSVTYETRWLDGEDSGRLRLQSAGRALQQMADGGRLYLLSYKRKCFVLHWQKLIEVDLKALGTENRINLAWSRCHKGNTKESQSISW